VRDSAPVLLLHGFPQTSHCWRKVAPSLGQDFRLVLVDLYEEPPEAGYSKRELAARLVEAKLAAGIERFAVVGHDRGGRVAYRMALDHPDRVVRACVLNVIPTIEQFERMAEHPAPDYWPFFLLAQPAPFPERLVEANAELVLRHVLEDWTAVDGAIDEDASSRYLAGLRPDRLAAICAEYRAAFHVDRAHDAEDRAAGRRIACPLLVHWGAEDMDDPLPVWRRWADDVIGGALPGGHFLPEEAPEELTESLRAFLSG
jgi:haloacetate dehalogenase